MSDAEHHEVGHEIAVRAANMIVREGHAAGLNWGAIAVSCETTIAIVVASLVELAGTPHPIALATEVIEMMTKSAHERVGAYIKARIEGQGRGESGALRREG